YDAQGKLVMQNILSAEQTPIQVSQLAPGSYSLTLNNETQNLKTFKLIKQQ
uniref:T9SS type A sorting domain-containing protein n=1 Tax=Flavobacterium sp. TaxID=239 RepID=UPI00404B1454